MSDGNRTRNIRFGRPTLSLLSFAHKFWCIGEDLNFRSVFTRLFYRQLALSRRRPMRKKFSKSKILCKNKKGRGLDRLRTQKCPNRVIQDFLLWNSPKFLSKKEIFPKLSAFLFSFERFSSRRVFAERKAKSSEHFFRLFSCQTSVQNTKKR